MLGVGDNVSVNSDCAMRINGLSFGLNKVGKTKNPINMINNTVSPLFSDVRSSMMCKISDTINACQVIYFWAY